MNTTYGPLAINEVVSFYDNNKKKERRGVVESVKANRFGKPVLTIRQETVDSLGRVNVQFRAFHLDCISLHM